jgi:hypothetical protein
MQKGFFLILFILIGTISEIAVSIEDDVEIKVKKQISSVTSSHRGDWDVNVAWVEVDTTVDYFEALRGIVKFSPNQNAPTCKNISFIQIAKVLDNDGNDYEWQLGEAPRNLIKTAASFDTEAGYYIDHAAYSCKKGKTCSPYFRDYWPNTEDGSRDGSNSAKEKKSAVLVDYPFGWEYISLIKLEACAYCRDSKLSISCFQWGGSWPLVGEAEFIIEGATDKPTRTFEQALSNFSTYYSAPK